MKQWDIKYIVYSPSGFGEWVATCGNESISAVSIEALTAKLRDGGLT